MSLWLKIVIGVWLYLLFGFGMALLVQLLVKKIEDDEYFQLDDAFDWVLQFKLDPDDCNFGDTVFFSIIFWPLVIVFSIGSFLCLWFKKIFRKLWEKLDEKDKENSE